MMEMISNYALMSSSDLNHNYINPSENEYIDYLAHTHFKIWIDLFVVVTVCIREPITVIAFATKCLIMKT